MTTNAQNPSVVSEQAQPPKANAAKTADVDRIGAYWEDQARRGCVDAFTCGLNRAWEAGAAHRV